MIPTDVAALSGGGDLQSQISDVRREIRHLQEAVLSHAVIDQAIGVVITVGGLRPDQGVDVLTAVSRRTGIGVGAVAEYLVDWVVTERLPDGLRTALDAALAETRAVLAENAPPVTCPVAAR
ncbi:ANTAR domain-containing protein [Streptomyces sp. NPDC020192]|uniref:ANTAR domain-containing protein n=1 Tax=Streptomyces sp. NPDC020192 TaxID=3365066 RepID=UPI00379393B0